MINMKELLEEIENCGWTSWEGIENITIEEIRRILQNYTITKNE
jgi:hypothetical protein